MAAGTTTNSMIDYEHLQQEAMRGVVRAVLRQVVASGLPGEHHFYISFLTQTPGVIMSKRLREKYPQEMTIVLQHRFWDLIVSEDRFEVKLTFDSIAERLVIPFVAIKVFIDPSVRFGLQFDEPLPDHDAAHQPGNAPRHAMTMDAAYDSVAGARGEGTRSPAAKKPRPARKPKADKDAAAASNTAKSQPAPAPATTAAPQPSPAATATGPTLNVVPAGAEEADKPAAPEGGAKILSLDQFRKK